MKRAIIFLFVTAILNSCANSKKLDLKPTRVTIEKIDSSFIRPFTLTALNNRLVLIGENEKSLVHLYDLIKLKTIFDGFETGRGPNEMLGPSSVQIRKGSNIWIYDIVSRHFNNLLFISDSLKLIKKRKIDQGIMCPNFISDSTIIALNFLESSKGWVIMFDKNGNYIKSVVDYPVDNDNDLPEPIFAESYQGRLLIKPDQQKFVVACRLADRLSIFDVKGNHISTFRSDYPFEPIITTERLKDYSIMEQNEETKIGFPEIAVSNDFIFALFSGKSRKTANPTFSNTIYQLTWTGELVNIYQSDLSIINLCWSDFHNCLYMCITDNHNYYLGKLGFSQKDLTFRDHQ